MSLRLVLAAAFALLLSPAPEAAPCGERLCNAEALRPFLAELKAGGPGDHRPFHILQIGDSHSAGDAITGPWRRRLQEAYGHGGRGVLAAGRPYAGYLTSQVTASQTPGWTVNATFGGTHAREDSLLGLSGFTQTAHAYGESLGLTADTADDGFDRLTVCAIARPGGGSVVLRIGDVQVRWSLEAPETSPECRILESQVPASRALITTVDEGVVNITSFGVFRRDGGAVLSNLGVPGSQLQHLARMSDEVIAAELQAYRPDLIILAFGTNEGFSPVLSANDVEASLRAQVARIRRLAGRDVPILLLGAPDSAGRSLARGGIACGDGWYVPLLLEQVRARQAAVARELGLAYWDWDAAMGGRCAASRWVAAGLMRPDHVHFTGRGGDRIAARLDAAFSRAVEPLP